MSRFVSAGTDSDSQLQDDAWLKAHQEVKTQRQPKSANQGQQDGGKSLYEVLQQNKAAKQEAFEEAARLKNQFRALDDDEVDFLDSVLESTRARETAVKQETFEQVEAFRKQRALAEQSLLDNADNDETQLGAPGEGAWAMKKKKKKRRRNQDQSSEAGTKLRKLSSPKEASQKVESFKTASLDQTSVSTVGDSTKSSPNAKQSNPKSTTIGLGLGGYSSDDDD